MKDIINIGDKRRGKRAHTTGQFSVDDTLRLMVGLTFHETYHYIYISGNFESTVDYRLYSETFLHLTSTEAGVIIAYLHVIYQYMYKQRLHSSNDGIAQ